MSEPDSPTRGDLHHQHHRHQQQLHQSSSQHNAEERDDMNSSIIGKVKSRVSSIFPQTLTKWFSPSTNPTTAATASNGGVSRRRRRNEECEDTEFERANNSDDDSNNSAEDEDISPAPVQPPTKRSRLNVEVSTTNYKETQSFSSSTPTTAVRRRTTTHLNLYGKQKEPAYNFTQTKITTTNTTRSGTTNNSTVDSADIIEVVPERNLNTSISSRRSLNIPSTSFSEGYRSLRDFKHQPTQNLRTASSASASPSVSSRMQQQRAGAKILEAADDDDDEADEDEGQVARSSTIVVDEVDEDEDGEDDNEESEEIAKVTSKKQKFTNGNLVGRSSSVATESGESRSSSVQAGPAKSGMFNPASRGLRTLSGNGLNFYSHLEGRKSLFSEKNMPGMLNNSTLSLTSLNRRQFNSSIYGSTSALSDSRLLNTSSPFYKGQTTYGGAAAYNTFNRSRNQSVRIAPTLIRPTSSLSTLSSSSNSLAQGTDQSNSTISSTAKRILELINDFSTPLNDAKKMASNIKTPAMWANSNAAGKRFSEADLASSRSVRLSTVRTPYFRPTVTLNPSNNDSKKIVPPLKELHVPSMSQLLQMKKMRSCTERSRQIATASTSALNKECEYKLPGEDEEATEKASNKHVSKIRNKVTASSRVSSKNANPQDEEAPAPANLPNVAFPFMHSTPKFDIPLKSNLPTPPEKKDSNAAPSKETKPTFAFVTVPKPTEGPKPTTSAAKPLVNFNVGSGSLKKPVASNNEFKFSSPLSLKHSPLKEDLTPINNFKFSSPVLVNRQNNSGKVVPATTPVPNATPQLKTGSVLDALKGNSQPTAAVTAVLPVASANTPLTKPTGTSLFGAQFKKPSNEWECDACMVRNKETDDNCVACTTPRKKSSTPATPALPSFTTPIKNTFGDAFKPKSDTWECSACMVRNKTDVNECVACNTKKPGGTVVPTPKLQSTDAGFKSLVAQQTASKWECDACMTRNDAERNKCVCCEQAKPGTQTVTDSVPKFSFGTSSASKFTFGFGNAGGKKEDELKAEVSKTENKTGFTFGIPAKTEAASNSSSTAPAKGTGILFGITPITNSTSSPSTGKDVPDVAKTNITGFKFGVPPAESSKSDCATATSTTTPTAFSFGIKADAKASSVKFNLPTTAAENKASTPSAASTSISTSSSSIATSSLFGTATTSAFGASPKAAESKSTESNKVVKSLAFAVPAAVSSSANAPETKGFVFGIPATVSSSASTPSSATTTNAIKPLTFGSSTSEANKSPPKITFGSSATSSATSAASTTASSSLFGKPVSTTAAFTKSPTSISGFAFGKEQSSAAPSLFGSQTTSAASAETKPSTPIFGAAVSSSAPTTASSAPTAFVFGKPSITPSFGASTASTTSLSTSVFGSKPSSVFPGVSAPSSSTSTSVVSSALAPNPAPTTTASSTPFVFGRDTTSSASQNNKPLFGSSPFDSGSSATPATAASSWPTNTFTFGSSKPVEEVKSTTMPAFGSPAPIFGSATPIFGSSQVSEVKPTQSAPAAVPTFGASAATSLFGSNSTSGNVFGSSTSTPLFGSTFGAAPAATAAPVAQANSNPSPATTFGSADSSFFSGFGSLAAASSSSTSDGASAPKKADIAFNFGGSQPSGNGGFSFGSNNNNKPADTAFKFTASSAPSFNFTGASETATATQPFQFGAPASTLAVFNFGGLEGSNAGGPFQFNAAAPAAATNNIFAPLPMPGSQTTNQQARRKMRTANRRLPPR